MKPSGNKTRVMVFGVFDRLHEGHRDFFWQARAYGDELIVVVARDSAVRVLKGRSPHEDEETRRKEVEKNVYVSHAVLGDEKQGSYEVITRYAPDIICLGYDQEALARDLAMRTAGGALEKIPVKRLSAFKPERYHTSLL